MRWELVATALMVLPTVSTAAERLDTNALVAAFREADANANGGKGSSDHANSSDLGWGEAFVLRQYTDLWDVTGDPEWLAKVQDHFDRMLTTARDADGDGYLGWTTPAYSVGICRTRALHNVGTATIEPREFRELDMTLSQQVTGHNYLIEFVSAGQITVRDATAGATPGQPLAYVSGEPIKAIPGLSVTISGEAHQGDIFLVETTAPEPLTYIVHEGMFLLPVAQFIVAVEQSEQLKERFGASAKRYLGFINRNIVQKHEREWLDTGDGCGAYRFTSKITDRYPNRILPHNQYLSLARVYLLLKDLPGASPLMATRVEAMARNMRAHLKVQGAAYTWAYWDWVEDGKPDLSAVYEDTAHAAITLGFMMMAGERGFVFTRDDMVRLTRTYLDLMWNGDEANPRLGPTVGQKGEEAGASFSEWPRLCQWEPRILDLAATNFERDGSPASAAPMMLWLQKHVGTL